VGVLSYVPAEVPMIPAERLTRFALLVGAATLIAGCADPAEPKAIVSVATPAAPADPIPDFVGYLRRNGIVLVKDPDLSNWWRVAEPSSEGPCDLAVALKGFPPGTTVSQMEHNMMPISLAHRLNAPARLAMSYPSLRCEPGPSLQAAPDPKSLPVSQALVRLFQSYRGPEASETAGH
jgi:hypothetical protein